MVVVPLKYKIIDSLLKQFFAGATFHWVALRTTTKCFYPRSGVSTS